MVSVLDMVQTESLVLGCVTYQAALGLLYFVYVHYLGKTYIMVRYSSYWLVHH